MSTAYLLLGSNQGNRTFFLMQGIIKIEEKIGKISKISSVYSSKAWGYESTNDFFNQAIAVETYLKPEEILQQIHDIEHTLGRTRNTIQYSDRTIDIDILFIDNLIVKTEQLHIPHPQFHNRKFAIVPLMEINSELVHPLVNKTIQALFNECNDGSIVQKI